MNNRALALLAAFGATTIYGMNHTIAKVVMPHYVGPFGFIMLRVIGASILFWSVSFIMPKETIERKDFFKIAYSYDVTVSNLGVQRTAGAHELSLEFSFCSKNAQQNLVCPRFH